MREARKPPPTDPPINHPKAAPPPLPGQPVQIPVELLQALTAEVDPWALLGHEYARRVQLENTVNAMRAWLQSLVDAK